MILVLDVFMSRASGAIQVAVSGAQERGRPEILFGHHWYYMIPEALVVSEVVLTEQVEWEEQSSGKHPVLTDKAEERGR